jgi:hypothetical protein
MAPFSFIDSDDSAARDPSAPTGGAPVQNSMNDV